MEPLWLIYWGLLLVSLIFSIIMIVKKNKITGLIQFILSLFLPVWAFIFALKRDYLSSGLSKNEIYFMYIKVISGDIEAIVIVTLFLVLIGIFIYNILLFKSKK